MSTARTVVLKGNGIRKEAIAASALYPCFLVERTSANKFQPHSAAGKQAQRMFAVEDDNEGKTITDVYAAAARVQAETLPPGAEVQVLIKDGETIVIGDPLESAGNGYLQKHEPDESGASSYDQAVVAWALEAIDLSDSSGADPASSRIAAEVA